MSGRGGRARALRGACAALLLVLSAAGARADDTESITVIGRLGPAIDRPMARSGMTAEALRRDGVTSLFDLGQVVPGLRIDRYGVSTQPNLRGIGVQNVLGPGINPDVAIYLDGYAQTGLSTAIDLANVARVDVLKGPQGTLFGQSALGGAVLVTTSDPDFQTRGLAAVSYGSFNDRQVQGYFTTALSDELAMDISVSGRQSDNYFTDSVTGRPSAPIDSLTVRGKLLYQIGEDGRLVLAGGFSDTSDPTGIVYTVHQPLAALYHDAFGVPQTHTETPYKTSLSHPPLLGPKEWSLSLSGEFDLGWAEVTSRSRFRTERNHMWSDQDGTSIPFWNADFRMRVQTVSQEFGLAGGRQGPLQWQAGVYYANDLSALHHNSSQDPFGTGAAASVFQSDLRVATDTLALFGDATWAMSEDWLLTAGARAGHERKSMRSRFLLTVPPTDGADSRSWDDFSPRLALRHAVGAGANLYVSVSQGFKSGNYNFVGVGPQAPVRPERVTQYEAGYKQAGADWTLDGALYLSNIRDLQSSTYVAACGCFQYTNAPRAQSYGAELSAGHALDGNFSVNAAIAWTHARYQQFIGEGPTGQPYVPPAYGYATGPTDFAGGRMLYSPDWTGNIGLDWHMDSDAGRWNAAANLYLTSRVPFSPSPQLSQAGYGLLNLSAGWTAPDAKWSVMASAQNVTGQRYLTFSSLSFLGQSMVYGAPTSWNLRLARSF